MSKLSKDLEQVITIDGKGRPWKARELLSLLNSVDINTLKVELEKIGKRKFL